MNETTTGKQLDAILAGILGYVPGPEELREALARPEDSKRKGGLPKGTFYDWTRTRKDRSVAALYSVAAYYHGRPDKDGQTIDGTELRAKLEHEFGYGSASFSDAPTRKGKRRKAKRDLSDYGY